MSKEVTNEQILQAISELSKEVKDVKQEVKENSDKIDKLDAKVTVLSQGLLDTQAEVKILKNAK
ncbi:hypothetical protein ABRT01_07845 [Lentibacillus sp. L22]|uniref:hypothetical protein n=1 Tax=Lentibacillus TaxID=175304 RepID=UPI0022B16F7A|nr:hypothetical protein [Lentibacillus daqui]